MRNILIFILLFLCSTRAVWCAMDVLVLYNGEATLPANMVLGVWGALPAEGRAITFTPLPVAPKVYGIPLALQGRYQGIRIDFLTPISTDTFLGKSDAFLELYLRSTSFTPSAHVPMPSLTSLRVTLFTQGGVNTLAVPSNDFYPLDEVDGNWMRLALPLNRLPAKYPLAGDLRRLLITTDSPVKLLLGRVACIRDFAMLRATISSAPAILRTGTPVILSAAVEGGLTPYAVSWNFGIAADPAVIDATGASATALFPKAGNYLITCTVRDTDGIKDPITVTRTVTITGDTVPSIKVNIDK